MKTVNVENLGLSDTLLADLREKGFCFGCDRHCSVCYPLAPNNVPPTNWDECVSERGKGGERRTLINPDCPAWPWAEELWLELGDKEERGVS